MTTAFEVYYFFIIMIPAAEMWCLSLVQSNLEVHRQFHDDEIGWATEVTCGRSKNLCHFNLQAKTYVRSFYSLPDNTS